MYTKSYSRSARSLLGQENEFYIIGENSNCLRYSYLGLWANKISKYTATAITHIGSS